MGLFNSVLEMMQHDNKEKPKSYYLRFKHVETGEVIEFPDISEQATTDVVQMLPCYAWDLEEMVEQRVFNTRLK